MISAHAQTRHAAPRFSFAALVNWLLAADRKYREHCRLRELSDEALEDVGLTRDAAGALMRK